MTPAATTSPAPSAADALGIAFERGDIGDYLSLAPFHYVAGRPATATAVFAAVRRAPSLAGRFLSRHGEVREPAAVLVCSLPHLACRARDVATFGRYAALPKGMRGALLNREMRTISRVVVDPRYRGLGLATALVHMAIAECDTPYLEALAAMGRVHPFFERAGMMRYDPPRRAEHERLLAAIDRAGIAPATLASPRTMLTRMRALPAPLRCWLAHECHCWHAAAGGGRSRRQKPGAPLLEVLESARLRALPSPVYYLAATRAARNGVDPSSPEAQSNHTPS